MLKKKKKNQNKSNFEYLIYYQFYTDTLSLDCSLNFTEMDSVENAEMQPIESIIITFGKYFLPLICGLVVLTCFVCDLMIIWYLLNVFFDVTGWLGISFYVLKASFAMILYILTERFLFCLLEKLWLLMVRQIFSVFYHTLVSLLCSLVFI